MTEPTFSDALVEYRERSLDNVRQNLPGIGELLRAAGIACIKVDYDGCGDSGQLEEPQLLDAAENPIALERIEALHRQRLMELLYDLVEARHSGWENNDGATGLFTWDLASGEIRHVHHERYTEYHTTEHHGL